MAAEPGPVPAFLHPFAATGATEFTTLVSGEGSTVRDADGREYLDAIASLWCVNVGHGRPEVIDAVAAQMRSLATYNTFAGWTNRPADALAERVASVAPMSDARVFFTNSGSEAIDTAIKLARHVFVLDGDAKRTIVVARDGGYHGTALGGTTAQGMEPNRTGFGPLVGDVVHVGRHDLDGLHDRFEQQGGRIAAIVTEPVQGASGVHPPDPGYLAEVRDLCDAHGALLVMDEVICGFGRLGVWFASERYGVEPDLVTFAKAVTSGYVPLGGVIVGARVRAALERDPGHLLRTGFTYSGHPTACAAALACLDVTEQHGLLSRATAIGERIGGGLARLATDQRVTDVRGVGAIWAVDVDTAAVGRDAPALAGELLGRGVIVRPIGARTLAMCPPLVMTDAEVDTVLAALAAVLAR